MEQVGAAPDGRRRCWHGERCRDPSHLPSFREGCVDRVKDVAVARYGDEVKVNYPMLGVDARCCSGRAAGAKTT